jgi:misacylated tRNA(Ala) deacylase
MVTFATSQTRVVGDLACQRDSYLRTLNTVVVSCVELSREKAVRERTSEPKGNSVKDVENASKTDVEEGSKLWEIEFADSVLFPEGMSFP